MKRAAAWLALTVMMSPVAAWPQVAPASAGQKTLAEAYPGRFMLGIGVSHWHLVEHLRKHSYAKPYSYMVEYLDGPFEYLENRWRFRPTGEHSSEVDFYIAYEFRSRVLGLVMGSVFDAAFRRFAEAFERRADEIYRVSGA